MHLQHSLHAGESVGDADRVFQPGAEEVGNPGVVDADPGDQDGVEAGEREGGVSSRCQRHQEVSATLIKGHMLRSQESCCVSGNYSLHEGEGVADGALQAGEASVEDGGVEDEYHDDQVCIGAGESAEGVIAMGMEP